MVLSPINRNHDIVLPTHHSSKVYVQREIFYPNQIASAIDSMGPVGPPLISLLFLLTVKLNHKKVFAETSDKIGTTKTPFNFDPMDYFFILILSVTRPFHLQINPK